MRVPNGPTTTGARLIAVDHVLIEAATRFREPLSWFYGQLIGLQQVRPENEAGGPHDPLRFRGERFELRIKLSETPAIEAVATRVHIEVPALERVEEALDDRQHPYDWVHGLSGTDCSLLLLDPAGNRVRLRQLWPFHPL